jgi:hypothetical protein
MNRLAALAICALALALAAAAAPPPADPPRAGEIRHVVPQGWLHRGAAEPKAATRADAVLLGDRLRTDRGGRARVGLDDGSVINVGSESELAILEHDPAAERTSLELGFGRVRASVVRLARPGARFEVRTPAATAGVIGTRFAVRSLGDTAEVFCLEGEVTVRSSDPDVPGEVRLRAGQFTRVVRGQPPAPAADATPEQLREIDDETALEPAAVPDFTRIELSWPPAGCGENLSLPVRAWMRVEREGKLIEIPADAEEVSGWLALGERRIWVEGGRAYLTGAADAPPAAASFTPARAAGQVAARVWPPLETVAGDGWRAPRATLAGSAFYVLGPMAAASPASFRFGAHAAQLLWSGPCGAAFLAPAIAGGEYDVELGAAGRVIARGKMNLIEIGYQVPSPPAIKRGQSASFGVRYRGLENLAAHTAGRPVLRSLLENVSPDVIGDLAARTPGATASGERIVFAIGPAAIAPDGSARLDATARGRRAGMYRLNADHTLDDALRLPRTPLTPVAAPSATADATRP